MLIKFFTHKKNLTQVQRRKLDFLLARDCATIAATAERDPNVGRLLDIWEKEGLDAAVAAWKELQSQPKKPKNEIIAGVKKEVEEGGGIPLEFDDDFDFGFDEDDIDFLESIDLEEDEP